MLGTIFPHGKGIALLPNKAHSCCCLPCFTCFNLQKYNLKKKKKSLQNVHQLYKGILKASETFRRNTFFLPQGKDVIVVHLVFLLWRIELALASNCLKGRWMHVSFKRECYWGWNHNVLQAKFSLKIPYISISEFRKGLKVPKIIFYLFGKCWQICKSLPRKQK